MPAWFRSSPGLYLFLLLIALLFGVPVGLWALGWFRGGEVHLPVCTRTLC